MNSAPITEAASYKFFDLLKMKDSRLLDRLQTVTHSIEQHPDQSFPEIFKTQADLAGFYRLVNNSRVEPDQIISAVRDSTIQSIGQEGLVLAIHDTSTFSFPSELPLEGMGRLSKGKTGFFGHFCIAVNMNREILGLLGLQPWIRGEERKGKRSKKELLQAKDSELLRWPNLICDVHNRLQNKQKVVHVCDREPDDYDILSTLVERNIPFVIRSKHNRKIEDPEHKKLHDCLGDSPIICEREVRLSPRKKHEMPHSNRAHPARPRRTAQLGISAKTIEICRRGPKDPNVKSTLKLNYVRVVEMGTPEGEVPIEWILTTTESISTPGDLLRIVDIYRCRWTIEEFFKALKSGCSYEKRGFESFHGLMNCLAIFAPIACKLYNLKMKGREQPDADSKSFVTPTQIKILSKTTKFTELQLQSVGMAMLAIGALGGHIKHNGSPGWQVLARGYETLLQLERGYLLFASLGTNQSEALSPNSSFYDHLA